MGDIIGNLLIHFDTSFFSAGVLARLRPPEVQAAAGEDHAVPDPDAKASAEASEEVGAAAEEGRTTRTSSRREGFRGCPDRQPDREGAAGATQEGNLRRHLQFLVRTFVLLENFLPNLALTSTMLHRWHG